jgi:hypothetical protein
LPAAVLHEGGLAFLGVAGGNDLVGTKTPHPKASAAWFARVTRSPTSATKLS